MLEAPAHLTERDRWLVRLVGEHRVLTTGQLTALGFANLTTARHRLSVLVRIGRKRHWLSLHFFWGLTPDPPRDAAGHARPVSSESANLSPRGVRVVYRHHESAIDATKAPALD